MYLLPVVLVYRVPMSIATRYWHRQGEERETNIPNGAPAQVPSNSLCDRGLLRHTEDLFHSWSSGVYRVFCGGGEWE